ncbi:HNH endonuclease [Afipia sp. DC4300-2b1]|uniref:HNH endonuclease n=1 Tax=Afipia sp. DC4300-2b1 TaxID=2804672 RepID=UPI003CF21A2A
MKLRGTSRKEFPLSVRKLAMARCCKPDGVPKCEGCGHMLSKRTGTIYEHVIPDGLGGEPTLENCKVHCKNCADLKTFTEDNPRMQKADCVFKKEYGLEPQRKTIQSRGFPKARPQSSASRPLRVREV